LARRATTYIFLQKKTKKEVKEMKEVVKKLAEMFKKCGEEIDERLIESALVYLESCGVRIRDIKDTGFADIELRKWKESEKEQLRERAIQLAESVGYDREQIEFALACSVIPFAWILVTESLVKYADAYCRLAETLLVEER